MLHLQTNISLKNKNWFNTGGSAKLYTEPTDAQAFAQAIEYANIHNLALFVLGSGANILISDDGFDGLVIRPNIINISHTEYEADKHSTPMCNNYSLVTAGAGVLIEDLIQYCLNHNIIGLEEFSGIPGTVGGSVYINIHYFTYFLSDFLHSAEVIHKTTGTITTVDKNWFKFGYDQSKLVHKEYFLLSATFLLKQVDASIAAYAAGRSYEIIRHRNARYPTSHTCGSFFRNFHDHEVTQYIAGTNKKMIFTAYYLDKIGVKGQLRIGGAVVSHKHANMIVSDANNTSSMSNTHKNSGNKNGEKNSSVCTSQDIIEVAKEMQQLVKAQFGIIPQPECQLIGFKEYPLL